MAEKKRRPAAFYIESGVPGVLLPGKGFPVDKFLAVLKYKPREDDLFVATYPKCGTTYLQQIIYLIHHDGVPATDTETYFKCCPFMERGLEGITAMPRPNAIKCHLPHSVVPYSEKAKYIYMARNPKDCFVSLYHHTFGSAVEDYNRQDLDDFFELFLLGAVEFGNYFANLLSCSMAEKKQGPPADFIESGVPGILLPSVFSVDKFLDVLKYKPTDEDLFVATYPKCGTTYLQQMIYLIYHDGVPATDAKTFFQCCPFMEVRGMEGIMAMPRPNAIKSHLPYSVIPYCDKTKYIYMARNPKDCVVSLYHHTFGSEALDYTREHFDDFFELFLVGAVEFGYYFSHLLSWYEHRNDENVLFLLYEETTKDPAATILKTAEFMGKEYGEKVKNDAGFLANIVKYSSFDYMKANMNDFYKKSKPGKHIRKGKVAGWRGTITEEQNEKLDALIKKHLSGTEVLTFWQQIKCI